MIKKDTVIVLITRKQEQTWKCKNKKGTSTVKL